MGKKIDREKWKEINGENGKKPDRENEKKKIAK